MGKWKGRFSPRLRRRAAARGEHLARGGKGDPPSAMHFEQREGLLEMPCGGCHRVGVGGHLTSPAKMKRRPEGSTWTAGYRLNGT